VPRARASQSPQFKTDDADLRSAGPKATVDRRECPIACDGCTLPHDYLAAEDELRGLAIPLDSHPSAADRVAWHWYPEDNSPPPASDELRIYRLLVDLTISLYDADSDWLELTLEIAWQQPSKLTVNAAVEVACWCTPDHNMHQARTASRQIANSHELAGGFAAAVAMLAEVLDSGPFDPHPWRVQAGLPDGPAPSR
jgi:hypothetical protein